MPDVEGRSEAEAEKMLQDAKLTVIHGKAENSDEVEEGHVISSDPEAGTEVEEGTEVTIVISLGEDQATVPDLRNKSASDAEAALKEAGLSGSASEEYSDSVAAGQVISQSIDQGEKVDKGTTISYVVKQRTEDSACDDPLGYSRGNAGCREETASGRRIDRRLCGGRVQ